MRLLRYTRLNAVAMQVESFIAFACFHPSLALTVSSALLLLVIVR